MGGSEGRMCVSWVMWGMDMIKIIIQIETSQSCEPGVAK